MKIRNLFTQGPRYSSNVYLITGTWNTLPDVNTLVDVGRDPGIIDLIMSASTGFGKKKVEQVVLTHSHYDHSSLLPMIREYFSPVVYGASASFLGIDVILKGGERLKAGDREFEVILTPGHSNDSLCLYCEEDAVLFAGDTPLLIRTDEGTYSPEFIGSLETLCSKNIRTIYFGHGLPLEERCNEALDYSLENVRKSVQKPQGIVGKI